MENNSVPIWRMELIEICKILKNNGIDIGKIHLRKTILNKRGVPTTLKDINVDGIDISKIIKENGLNEDFPIGYYIGRYRNAYNGTRGNLTQEEREEGELLGIVVKRNPNVSTPIFKGKKISQFHLDFIAGILDEILNGKINTKEALELLRQASIEKEETIIKDSGSIKRCVEILLKDRPKDIKTYHKTIKKNSGRRYPYREKIGKTKLGLYHEKEEEFKQYIITQYLPLILNGDTTFRIIEKETSCSHCTINEIIEEFYINNNDLEGLQKYQEAKRKSQGVALKVREEAKRKRREVTNYNVVSNKEFVLLSPEEQMLQLIMKIRKEKLKEELSKTNMKKNALISETSIKNKVNILMNYFKRKNNPNSNEVYFSDEDIRYMIFRYPTLISRSIEVLDKKLEVLKSYKDIDEETAYGIIKDFPAIMGYNVLRTKKQLDLLEKEGLIDAVISKPRRFMLSVELMYALIQYAKERHHTSDLSEINRKNIFKANSDLKRIYGISHDEIKAKYPYIEEETQDLDTISPNEILKATYNTSAKPIEARNVLENAMIYKGKE